MAAISRISLSTDAVLFRRVCGLHYVRPQEEILLVLTHFIFLPSALLLSAATEFGAADDPVLKPSVWTVREHDRTGAEHSQGTLEESFWMVFLANLIENPPEPERAKSFRARCLELGFRKCWSVQATKSGGDAIDLVEEAQTARGFPADSWGRRVSLRSNLSVNADAQVGSPASPALSLGAGYLRR